MKEKIKYEDIIADLEKKTTSLNEQLQKEQSNSLHLQKRLISVQTENENLRYYCSIKSLDFWNMLPLRSLSADLRAHLRSGLSGLELAKPSSRPASVPALGDVTRNILGVKTGGGEEDEDSAYQDPNTDSLRSRPKSSARGGVGLVPPVPSVPQPGGGPRAAASPPTKLAGAGAGQLPGSPARNLFPDTGRTQSRSSTLVDAESLQEDKSKPWTRSSSVFTVTCFRSVIPAAAAGSVRDPVPGW